MDVRFASLQFGLYLPQPICAYLLLALHLRGADRRYRVRPHNHVAYVCPREAVTQLVAIVDAPVVRHTAAVRLVIDTVGPVPCVTRAVFAVTPILLRALLLPHTVNLTLTHRYTLTLTITPCCQQSAHRHQKNNPFHLSLIVNLLIYSSEL